jgi:hypothetical protein
MVKKKKEEEEEEAKKKKKKKKKKNSCIPTWKKWRRERKGRRCTGLDRYRTRS